jgi:hypothetical protein
VLTEHKNETGDGLLNCEATPITIRLSRPISTSGLFSQKEAKIVTLNGTSWTMIVHKTQNSEPRSAFRMVKLQSLGGATYHRFLCGPFSQPESANNSKTMRI